MSARQQASIRILGVGSPFGADAVGFRAVDLLGADEELHSQYSGLEFASLDRPGTTLIRYLEGASVVVIIDAMQAGLPPHSVERIELRQLLGQGMQPSSHDLGLSHTLQLAQALGVLPAHLLIYGIEAVNEPNEGIWFPELKSKLLAAFKEIAPSP